MQVFRHIEEVPPDFGPTVISVGNFDGVHCAHRHVLREVVIRARTQRAKAIALTFDPHPTRILRPDVAPKLITPLPIKLSLLAQTGLDAALVMPFSRDLSLVEPRDFVEDILVRRLQCKEIHEGDNFHFGHNARGNAASLAEFGREYGFQVVVYPGMRLRGEMVSSSRIRDLLRDGRMTRARHLLGRPFSIFSTPGRGRGYGHKYTVPTINLSRYDELTPRDGVYITRTRVNAEWFDSVTNVGMRPTFEHESFAIETHLLHFHPIDVTAQTEVEVEFLYRLRDEIKFPSVDDLRAQIARDVARARRYFHLRRQFCPAVAQR